MNQTEEKNLNNNLSHMLSFASEIISPSKNLIPEWMLVEHRCSNCNRVLSDKLEIEYEESSGYCGFCEEMMYDRMLDESDMKVEVL